MPITCSDANYYREKPSAHQLFRDGRLFTRLADLLTGVVERREHPTYDSSTVRQWIGDSQKVYFKVATYPYWGARVSRNTIKWPRRFVMEGSAEEIVSDIESIRGWPDDDENCRLQYLRYKDGRIKITVSGGPPSSD